VLKKTIPAFCALLLTTPLFAATTTPTTSPALHVAAAERAEPSSDSPSHETKKHKKSKKKHSHQKPSQKPAG
jgi:hypothetical protein